VSLRLGRVCARGKRRLHPRQQKVRRFCSHSLSHSSFITLSHVHLHHSSHSHTCTYSLFVFSFTWCLVFVSQPQQRNCTPHSHTCTHLLTHSLFSLPFSPLFPSL
jgi:hypothetical protein